MPSRSLFTLLFLVFVQWLAASTVTIHGRAADYAGEKIVFNVYSDLITNTETPVSQAIVAPDGSFSCTFELGETRQVFTHLGIYRLSLFAKPGRDYEVSLPPWQEKTEADRLNPYFEEADFAFIISNQKQDELNQLIRMFDDAYEPYFDKYAKNLQSKDRPVLLDSSIVEILRPFRSDTDSYFRQYCYYKIGLLRHMAYQYKSRAMSDQFFIHKPIQYHNPAYMALFNQVYDKYFMYFLRTPNGQKIADDINRSRSLGSLKRSLSDDQVLKGDSLLELVILKNLYDEFYSDRFSRSAIFALLDSVINGSPVTEHRLIAQNMKSIITRLLPGFDPPAFALLNRDSSLVKLSDLRGKYVYLCFCSCYSYSCLKEFDMLQKLYTKLHQYVEVVVISVDGTLLQMKDFLARSHYNWTFLHYGQQPGVIKDYDIRGYPTYFLIDKQGKLVLSPAPSPFENVESKMFEIMRAKGDI